MWRLLSNALLVETIGIIKTTVIICHLKMPSTPKDRRRAILSLVFNTNNHYM